MATKSATEPNTEPKAPPEPAGGTTEKADATVSAAKNCGLVMPISALDGLPPEHWVEVRAIVTDAIRSIKEPGFNISMVSEADDVGLIHRRIVQNIYTSDVVVADVSGRNPNVMLEIGMRLAFDKPIVLIVDDQTPFTFDAGPIEHLPYPRDLRFSKIVSFKEQLAAKVRATYEVAQAGTGWSFLRSFGSCRVAHVPQEEVSGAEAMLASLEELRREMGGIRRLVSSGSAAAPPAARSSPADVAQALGISLAALFATVETYVDQNSGTIDSFIADEKVYRAIAGALGMSSKAVASVDFRRLVESAIRHYALPF